MNTRILHLLLIFAFGKLMSCHNDDDIAYNNTKNVMVLRESNKCEILDNVSGTLDYLIEFEQGTPNLPMVNHSIYYAGNLPHHLKVDGLPIRITFRNINDSKLINCDSAISGDDYPFIYILSAN